MTHIARTERDLGRIAEAVGRLQRSRNGTVTLTENVASTTVIDPTVTENSRIFFEPLTANAATELYGATMIVPIANHDRGSFTITHANNAQTDRVFGWVALGD
jgi:hypothetical protein